MQAFQAENELVHPGSFSCPGCGLTVAYRHVLKALGPDTVVVTTAGCGSVVAGYYPMTSIKVPFFHCSFGTAASTASGLRAGLDMMGKESTQVLAWAGDGGTFDIGLQALSGAAERNDDMIYVCYDNEAYMNTGVQRSSATPLGTWTTTTPGEAPEDRVKKDIAGIMAAHGVPYIAAACVSFPEDLREKVRRARAASGFRFLHLLAPCPTGWMHPASETIHIGRLAVGSRTFPLFEIFDGEKIRLSPMPEKVPVTEYLKPQRRFRTLNQEDVLRIQEDVDRRWSRLLNAAGRGEV